MLSLLLILSSFLFRPQCQLGFSCDNWCWARICSRVIVKPGRWSMPKVLVLERGGSFVGSRAAWSRPWLWRPASKTSFTETCKEVTFFKKLALKICRYYVGNVNLVTVRNFIKKSGTYLRLGLHGTSEQVCLLGGAHEVLKGTSTTGSQKMTSVYTECLDSSYYSTHIFNPTLFLNVRPHGDLNYFLNVHLWFW